MPYYFAPMEGITDRIYRRLHRAFFGGVQRYYTPFFSPTTHRCLTPRESRELPPADSMDCTVVPQMLTKNAADFLWMARQCADLGYTQVDLNLGCPSGTVTAKGKGAGMLSDLPFLDGFLSEIFADAPLPVSVKTRIGFHSAEEFPAIVEVLNRYPICELTVHPRVRDAFYGGDADMSAFDYAVSHSRAAVCYNGDIGSLSQAREMQEKYPQISAVMIGRALVGDPGMLSGGTRVPELRRFHDALFAQYAEAFGSRRNAVSRMKESWNYWLPHFEGSEKLGKQLRKTNDASQYLDLAARIFDTLPYC